MFFCFHGRLPGEPNISDFCQILAAFFMQERHPGARGLYKSPRAGQRTQAYWLAHPERPNLTRRCPRRLRI
jgi:hypothetical protein